VFLELHIIQNFAPSNLNRDDRGAPKDCEFGGVRRARISSQCIKRAIRTALKGEALLSDAELASRTKRVVDYLASRLASAGHNDVEARSVVGAALAGIGLQLADADKTQYLLYLGAKELDVVAELCRKHWDTLIAIAQATKGSSGAKQSAADSKKAGKAALDANVREEFLRALDGRRAADLALFGRMIADMPDHNVDAASQVAHAISTNRLSAEFDFYTAVDDLKPEDTAGADMLGTIEFNSACFYRYANVDLAKLARNLDDPDLARRTLEAFIRASISAIPTGKQNSFAAQNPPSLVLAVLRDRGLCSLANAFVQPVRPDGTGDLVGNSIRALDDYWGKLTGMYGTDGIQAVASATYEPEALSALKSTNVGTVEKLVGSVLARADELGWTAGAAKGGAA